MQLSRRMLFHLSVFTLVGMSAIGYGLLRLAPNQTFEGLMLSGDYLHQLGAGLGIGLGVSIVALLFIRLPLFRSVRGFFGELIGGLDLGWPHILFYSFCAAVGEEILFRGAIQEFIGIWPTAVVFVLLHGYLNPRNLSMSIYGVFLVFVAALFGFLLRWHGIYAAMAAHFVYDVIMFGYLRAISQAAGRSS